MQNDIDHGKLHALKGTIDPRHHSYIYVPSAPYVQHFEIVLQFEEGIGVVLNEQMGELPYFELLSPVDVNGSFLARIPYSLIAAGLTEEEMRDVWIAEEADKHLRACAY